MKSSCMTHPEYEPLVIIRKSPVEFCEGNQCAAAVLSFLEYWHNRKLSSDSHNKKSNDISEKHSDPKSLSKAVYQYHTLTEISDGIMNLYGTKKISASIKLLESLGVISTHKNPNPKYRHDRTTYFILYPEVYNNWIKSRLTSDGNNSSSDAQKGITDTAKMPHRDGKKDLPCGKNTSSITEINYRDINKSIKERDDFFVELNKKTTLEPSANIDIQPVVDALIQKGISLERLHYPDVVPIIEELCQKGATPELFVKAYEISTMTTSAKGFGIRYLEKVVLDLLIKNWQPQLYDPKSKSIKNPPKVIYEHDFSGGLDWMGDLVS